MASMDFVCPICGKKHPLIDERPGTLVAVDVDELIRRRNNLNVGIDAMTEERDKLSRLINALRSTT